jgi:hypothetical protein
MQANAHADDSAEGNSRWWLDSENDLVMEELLKALDWMKQHDLVEETVAADARRRYGRLASDAQLAELLAKSWLG